MTYELSEEERHAKLEAAWEAATETHANGEQYVNLGHPALLPYMMAWLEGESIVDTDGTIYTPSHPEWERVKAEAYADEPPAADAG